MGHLTHKTSKAEHEGHLSLKDCNFARNISRSCITLQKSQNDQTPIELEAMKTLKITQITTNIAS